jgi:transmembrane sensor
MGNFECNSIEDLVFSRSFRNWVFNRKSSEAGFWENWIASHPEKKGMIDHAKAVIYALQLHPDRLSDAEVETEVQKIMQRVKEGTWFDTSDAGGKGRKQLFIFRRPVRLRAIAAVFAGLCLLGYVFYQVTARRDVLQTYLADHKNDAVRQQVGSTAATSVIHLPDGSTVTLGQHSKLYYTTPPAGGNGGRAGGDGKREVYLDGEAFFDVRKDAARPFYVYTGQVITKVLGTSFFVRSNPSDPTTVVIVRTGKVSVYGQDDYYTLSSHGKEPGGIILTPNQEIVYDRQDRRLKKILSDKPERLPETADSSLAFNGTPVSTVFRRLQALYGIPILYDEEAVSSCSLSATMGNESFYEKISIICKAINATYEVIDGNIVITAPGCK